MTDRSLGVLAAASFLLFAAVAALVFGLPSFTVLDGQVALAINALPIGQGGILVAASLYGREYFWIPVVAVMLLLGNRRTKLLAVELAAAFVVGIAAGEALKFLLFRTRPYFALAGIVGRVPIDADSSFPSGHALVVSIGASFVLARFSRRWLSSLLTVEAVVVCFSRVYVGAHYPSDVVAGAALGAFIAFLSILVIERHLSRVADRLVDLLVRLFREGPLRV